MHDVVIVGAGFAGLYALHRLRGQGLDAIIVEAGPEVGGTWYWNRYPGARVDIESIEYSYAFSEELQQEWRWSERYAAQPELLRYLKHVADRFDLRRSIRFETRVASARFDDEDNVWHLMTTGGEELDCRYCVLATGFLSAPNQPQFPSMDEFRGESYHTAHWPHEPIDFTGKRVGVIGTGSSAIQVIPIVAEQAEHLTVFQRTPPFVVPLRNCPMPPDYEREVKSNYREWRRREREESKGGFISVNFAPITPVRELAMDVGEEERLALYEDRWRSGGLALVHVYPDIFVDERANDTLADFLREKIRSRIDDPALAKLLLPTGYPALTKRLCADTGYYESFNRSNTTLVDVRGKALAISEAGVMVDEDEYPLDVIIYATGFDALTGALKRIDIRGPEGEALSDHWLHGARTAFGMMSAGFPNMFMLNGPGSPCVIFNPILLAEAQGDWIGDWISYLDRNGVARIEPSTELEQQWVDHCTTVIQGTLFPRAASWYVGSNIPGKPSIGLVYFGSVQEYRARCQAILPSGFAGFDLHEARRAALSIEPAGS